MDENGSTVNARREFDDDLEVRDWRVVPAQRVKERPADVPAGAPSWWYGDEDASSSTLAALRGMTAG